MSNPAFQHAKTLGTDPAALAPGKGRKKKFSSKIPRNPLISLDSNERIQGNPNKSNPH
jgi:hypothetical protein